MIKIKIKLEKKQINKNNKYKNRMNKKLIIILKPKILTNRI